MEYLIAAVLAAVYGGSIYAAVVYTKKAMEAAHEVKLSEPAPPPKRAYKRKAKVVAAKMEPATHMTQAGQQAMNGAYRTGHTNGLTSFE